MNIVRAVMVGSLLCFMTAAFAQDAPKRKPGLWEIKTSMAGMPQVAGMGAMQQCIDASTDKLAEQRGMAQAQCSKPNFTTRGDTVTFKSSCTFNGTTADTEGKFSGDFSAHYTGEIRTHYTPPMHGMADMTMTIEARWLGACKPGQQPGDIVMPNGMKVNPGRMPGAQK